MVARRKGAHLDTQEAAHEDCRWPALSSLGSPIKPACCHLVGGKRNKLLSSPQLRPSSRQARAKLALCNWGRLLAASSTSRLERSSLGGDSLGGQLAGTGNGSSQMMLVGRNFRQTRKLGSSLGELGAGWSSAVRRRADNELAICCRSTLNARQEFERLFGGSLRVGATLSSLDVCRSLFRLSLGLAERWTRFHSRPAEWSARRTLVSRRQTEGKMRQSCQAACRWN